MGQLLLPKISLILSFREIQAPKHPFYAIEWLFADANKAFGTALGLRTCAVNPRNDDTSDASSYYTSAHIQQDNNHKSSLASHAPAPASSPLLTHTATPAYEPSHASNT